MADQDERSFNDIVGDLRYGDSLLVTEEDETTAEGSTEESETESTSGEQPSGESNSETEAKPDGETVSDETDTHESDESEEKGGETEDESKESSAEGDDEPVIELDGEMVPLSEVRRWKSEGLMQADYTRKTQEVAAERKSVEAQLAERESLMDDIFADQAMSSFVKAHPKVMKNLLADPENTRAVLGNAEEVQRLWDDYELLLDRPHLADKVFGQGEAADTSALEQERYVENIGMIANALDSKVSELASEYEGVDDDVVRDYVLSLGGVPTGEGADPAEVGAGFEKLFNLMFLHDSDSGQTSLDETLIRNHFELLSRSQSVAKSTADAEADEHNRQVDEQLNDQSSAPSTGGGSKDGPGPDPEPLQDDLSIGQRIARLRGID